MSNWPIVIAARTTSSGDLIFNQVKLASLLRRTKPCEITLVLERLGATRSARSNRYYWGVVVDLLSEHLGEEREDVHTLLKARFLTQQVIIPHAVTGEVVEEITIGRSSRKLDTQQFSAFIERIKRWAAQDLGVVIPDPDARLRTVEEL